MLVLNTCSGLQREPKNQTEWTCREPFRCLNVDTCGASFDTQRSHRAFRDASSVLSCFGPLKGAKML